MADLNLNRRPRAIRESNTFLEQAEAIYGEMEEFDRMLDGLKWVLARIPEAGSRVGDTRLHAVFGQGSVSV